METEKLNLKSQSYLKKLCEEILERCVGSEGNRIATRFFEKEISSFGWDTESQEFEAIDWKDGDASLQVDSLSLEVFVSPYSLGCEAEEQLISVSSTEEFKQIDIKGKIVLLHGEIAKEQLMPKNFVFYNPEEHQQIIFPLTLFYVYAIYNFHVIRKRRKIHGVVVMLSRMNTEHAKH